MRKAARLAICVTLMTAFRAQAALPPALLNQLGISLTANANLPLDARALDVTGRQRTLRGILSGRPAFVVFVDYTCKNLCGPALVLLSAALNQSRVPSAQYRLIVIGIDPKDKPADAARMAAAQIRGRLRDSAVLLLPDARNLAALTQAAGFRYAYDPAIDQFAHPEAVYAVAADGHVIRIFSPLTLTAADIETAFTAPQAPPDTFASRFRLLCYHFQELTGIHTAAVQLLLKLASLLTLAGMAGAVFLMRRRRRGA